MDTHKLLSEMGYNGNTVENYPQLAKAVADKAKSGCTETKLKDYVLKCGMVFKRSFSSSLISYPKCGNGDTCDRNGW